MNPVIEMEIEHIAGLDETRLAGLDETRLDETRLAGLDETRRKKLAG